MVMDAKDPLGLFQWYIRQHPHKRSRPATNPFFPWERSGTGSRDPLLSVSVGMASVWDPSQCRLNGWEIREGGGLGGHKETTGAPVDSLDFGDFFFFFART